MRKLRDKMYKWKGMRERRREEREIGERRMMMETYMDERRGSKGVEEISYNDNNARDYLNVKRKCRIVRKFRSTTRNEITNPAWQKTRRFMVTEARQIQCISGRRPYLGWSDARQENAISGYWSRKRSRKRQEEDARCQGWLKPKRD